MAYPNGQFVRGGDAAFARADIPALGGSFFSPDTRDDQHACDGFRS